MNKITADYILQQADAEEGPGCCDPEWERMSQVMRAAPELLEALEYSRRFLRKEDHDTEYVDAIIAKAKGEQA